MASSTLETLFPGLRGAPGVDSLSSAFEEICDEVRKLAPALEGLDLTSAAALAGAPQKTREAYLALLELDERHRVIRVTQAARRRQPIVRQQDPDVWPFAYAAGPGTNVPNFVGWFFDCHAMPEIHPSAHSASKTTAPRPGPSEKLARLVWLATDPSAEAWVPSPEEQDARFGELQASIRELRAGHRRGDRGKVIPAGAVPPVE